MINVIYDVSVYGSVQKWPDSRAGIYRVVENLAKALINSNQCRLTFGAFESDWHYYALKHMKETPERNGTRLIHSPVYENLFDWYLKADRKNQAAAGLKELGWRVVRKTLRLATKLSYPRLVFQNSLKSADVFHSPYFAIPPVVRGQAHLTHLLTVHDIIAVLYPEYMNSAHHIEDFKSIINSIRRDDWIISVSQRTKEDLCDYRRELDPSRVFVTHLGASDWFYPCLDAKAIKNVRLKYKIPNEQYILSVCTLEPRKNLPHLIRCFSQLALQERLKDLQLVLVGNPGWKCEALFSQLAAVDGSVRSRIIVTGRVADGDLAALYSGAVAFAYPSLYEGFGLPPLEAMQCATPVITSNTSSLPEVVGDAGILIDPHDADGLCEAMHQVAGKPDLREAMSRKSREQAGRFSWRRCAEQTLAAYATAIHAEN